MGILLFRDEPLLVAIDGRQEWIGDLFQRMLAGMMQPGEPRFRI
jgi:hypothetical protein